MSRRKPFEVELHRHSENLQDGEIAVHGRGAVGGRARPQVVKRLGAFAGSLAGIAEANDVPAIGEPRDQRAATQPLEVEDVVDDVFVVVANEAGEEVGGDVGADGVDADALQLAGQRLPLGFVAERVEALYLATLARKPEKKELDRAVQFVENAVKGKDGKAGRTATSNALADVFWALLNSPEFVLNH